MLHSRHLAAVVSRWQEAVSSDGKLKKASGSKLSIVGGGGIRVTGSRLYLANGWFKAAGYRT